MHCNRNEIGCPTLVLAFIISVYSAFLFICKRLTTGKLKAFLTRLRSCCVAASYNHSSEFTVAVNVFTDFFYFCKKTRF